MKKILMYISIFIWGVIFSYFYNGFMPKETIVESILYFLIGMPILAFGGYIIIRFFKGISK